MKVLAFFGGMIVSLFFLLSTAAVTGSIGERKPGLAFVAFLAGMAALISALVIYARLVR